MQTAVSEAAEKRYAELQQMALDFARNGEIELLASMLEAGMPVNLSDAKGNSLLMLASYMLKWPPERDRAARTNHYHQRGANSERGEAAHIGLDDAQADGEDREDRPDELNKVLVRSGFRFGFA